MPHFRGAGRASSHAASAAVTALALLIADSIAPAVHGGRYDEANSWLQVCMESGSNMPSRYWAADILGKWKGAGCALSELERRNVS